MITAKKTASKTASKNLKLLVEDQKEIRRLKELEDLKFLKDAFLRLKIADDKQVSKPVARSVAKSVAKAKISYCFEYVSYKKAKKAKIQLCEIKYFTVSLVKESELTGELPLDYDENRLVLQILDPFVAHAYWEISLQERCRLRLGYGGHFVLRLHNITDSTKEEIWFPEDVGNCFVSLPKSASIYRAELGYYSSKRYSCVAISNAVYAPTDKVSENPAQPVTEDVAEVLDVIEQKQPVQVKYTFVIDDFVDQEPDEKDSGSENFKPL